ncbi:hypothetical protein ABT083_35835 [Streptomyces goshikiensis]|uniref:hypothetical protein n=1 Tax=Streptomyces goshikiensis TaxID=1942 RepID=UPI00331CAD39
MADRPAGHCCGELIGRWEAARQEGAPPPPRPARPRRASLRRRSTSAGRDLYKHWNRGLNAADGCDTRKEVILAGAVGAPQVAAGCEPTGGTWRSAYDNLVVTDEAGLDVDHFVPLAEVHDSERTPWSAARREAYASDQASPDTLIAVSSSSNRSKPRGVAALGRLLPPHLRSDLGG